MDIIDLILDYFTDFKLFEKLATEIMVLEGYGTINPIGGIDDEGIDAEVKYFNDESQRTVFQFTIQQNIVSKINDTIEKLKKNKIKFQELIIVTKNQIDNVQKYRTDVRKKHKINLEIYEKRIFIKHLGTNNEIITRYFPDIKSQLNSQLLERKSIFTDASSNNLELSLLKCSLLFTFNPKSEGARKDIFDHTILGIIVSGGKEISKEKILNEFKLKFGREIPIGELDATIGRLKKQDLISINSTTIAPTVHSIERIESSLSKINSATQSLINEIVANVKGLSDEPIDKRIENIISTNIKDSLSAYFRLYGLDYSHQNPLVKSKELFENNKDLIVIAKKGLRPKVGELVVYFIGEIIKSPSPSQTETLASWAKAFIGLQIMGLDPKLSNFQATRLKEKTFIVDTDFLLYCIVQDCSLSSIFLRTIKELQNQGCKIIIPNEVIYEAIKHAEFAYRSYKYFRNAIGNVDPFILEDEIGNIFVKGYFSAVKNGKIDSSETSFSNYLSNYLDKENPFAFLLEVIKSVITDKFHCCDIADISKNPIELGKLEELTKSILEETVKTHKAGYRSEEENREVAQTDAKLFLIVNSLNQKDGREGEILAGSHYLITSSSRSHRCANKLGYKTDTIIKPAVIINLLEKIGHFSPTSKEIVNLFENPYLIEAVNNSWEDIKALVDAGFSLREKNVVRLRWDLDSEIKSFLSSHFIIEVGAVSGEKQVEEYIGFIRKIKSKGYKLIPEAEVLELKFTEYEQEKVSNKEVIQSIQREIEKFGKRKQQYLERIKKGKKNQGK